MIIIMMLYIFSLDQCVRWVCVVLLVHVMLARLLTLRLETDIRTRSALSRRGMLVV